MKHVFAVAVGAALAGQFAAAEPVSAQRLLDEWRVRTTAGADALARGATAVFLNPAQVVTTGRGEATVADLRAPGLTGVDGLAAAVAVRLDGRTTLAVGYEHVDVTGLEGTTTSPDAGAPLDIGENRFGLAASHAIRGGARVGAMVQYTRVPPLVADRSIIAMGAGVEFTPRAPLPVRVAGALGVEGDDFTWLGGVELGSGPFWSDWQIRGQYGASGGDLQPGTTHRLTAIGEWAGYLEVAAGGVIEPDGKGRSLQPVLGAELRLHRYSLGMVREQLPNQFGGAWSFRFTVAF
jgi:hypothetical protein